MWPTIWRVTFANLTRELRFKDYGLMQMKQLSLLILALILLTACQPQHRTVQLPPPPSAPAPPPHQPTTLDEKPEQAALGRSTALLKQLTLTATTSLPDAVLNATRCFVFAVPNRAEALTSCRSGAAPYDWGTPELMWMQGAQPPDTALLILVLSKRAAEALTGGALDLASFKTARGKTLSDSALLTERDLGYDVITYSYAQGTITGIQLTLKFTRMELVRKGIPANGRRATSKEEALRKDYVDWVQSYFNTITPSGIIIHHSATIPGTGRVPDGKEEIDEYHAERGMQIECFGREYHVAYHYIIFPNGKIESGRPERCEGAHARGYNSYLGISLVGDFSSKDNTKGDKGPSQPTARQMKALIHLTRALQEKYNIPVHRILRHSDVAPTLCPGDRFAFKTYLEALEQPSGK